MECGFQAVDGDSSNVLASLVSPHLFQKRSLGCGTKLCMLDPFCNS
jgi:hypothetical protein